MHLADNQGGEYHRVCVVAVHRLNGDSRRIWTTEGSEKMWLKDLSLLPSNLKKSRILTYGYNANVTAMFGKTSSDRTLQHAHTLVAQMVADREASLVGKVDLAIATKPEQIAGRCDPTAHNLRLPLTWRHCGATCKTERAIQEPKVDFPQAMAYSAGRTSKSIQHVHSIYVSTFGILFLGTTHDGGNKAKLAPTSRCMIGALVPSKIVDTERQLLNAMQEGSDVLQNITDMFVPLMKDFHIFFFWEQEQTSMGVTQDYVRRCSSLKRDCQCSCLAGRRRILRSTDSRSYGAGWPSI
ncbi:MAG: hypothetical protein ALECFALPRED_003875 [Alectoria fallacina]|uniref:Uncharacterized protein n=1 Tax=Alectoria fallacina TaxID=1903189 RepID=A0A8H3EM59_9LECA|nr:MAG: hypothetical protein ALECFALPRED_003875 [Alectoria fallacina]